MRAQGFTLIELLLMLAIIAILAGLAAPNMGEYIEQERVRGAFVNIKQELSYARSEAIKRNATIFISSSPGTNWCVGMSLTANCDCSITNPNTSDACALPINGTKVLRRITSGDYSGVTMNTDHAFSFDGTRGLASSSGSFDLSSDNYSGKAVISILGRVKACGTVSGMEGC